MNDLEIFDIYENANKEKSQKFVDEVDSSLRIKIDTKREIKDIEWIEKMEETIPYIDNILRSPNRFIVNEEEIVKIELARKITVDSIKHLSKNTNLIQSVDKKTGDVTPSKILNINKEESYNTYENRLIYTLIQNMKMFIERRKSTLEQSINKENKNDKTLDYKALSKTDKEKVEVNLSLNSTLNSDTNDNEKETKEILEKIEELGHRILDLTSSEVYKTIDKLHISLVREPIKKTNVILKNVNFQYAMKLWNYLRDNFDDKTKDIEENQDYMESGEKKKLFDETFMLQYLIMKTLDQDEAETEGTREEIKETILEQMINNLVNMDADISEEELNKMIANKYEVIKYKKMEAIKEIQNIFREHIDKYSFDSIIWTLELGAQLLNSIKARHEI